MAEDADFNDESEALSFDLFDDQKVDSEKQPANRRKGKGKGKAKQQQTLSPQRFALPSQPVPEEPEVRDPGQESGSSSKAATGKHKGGGKGAKSAMASTGGLLKKQQDAFNKAKDLLAKAKTGMTNELLWNNNVRARAVESSVKGLTTAEQALLDFVSTHKPAEELSRNITAFCDNLEVRFAVLKTLRQTPFHYLSAENIDDSTWQLLLGCQISLLTSLITHVATAALKTIDQD